LLAGAPDASPLEAALVELVRKAHEIPARLSPGDLDGLRALVGAAALDYALVVAAFHFINRVADLLHVDAELLPERLRRFDLLRRVTVRAASFVMARMDLAPRVYPATYAEAVARFTRATGRVPGDALVPLASRPKLVEAIELALVERDVHSSLDRATLARVHRAVEAALPARPEEATGFHARPPDPVEAFAFVGTRYAARTTPEMIDALRRTGRDDLGILDLAIAVADANQWARLHRLAGLPPDFFYVGGS
jgi:alkylhydroperoxidase family enzyme